MRGNEKKISQNILNAHALSALSGAGLTVHAINITLCAFKVYSYVAGERDLKYIYIKTLEVTNM